MINIDNAKLEVKGTTPELVSKVRLIVESLYESMNIIEKFAFTHCLIRSMSKGLNDKEESND